MGEEQGGALVAPALNDADSTDDSRPKMAGAGSRPPSRRLSFSGMRHPRLVRPSRVEVPKSARMDDDEDDSDHVPPTSGFRLQVYKLCRNKYFDYFILFCIALNCIAMACADPLDTDETSERNVILAIVDWVLLGIFTIEMVLKLVGFGPLFYFCKQRFNEAERKREIMPNTWNILDFVVVLAGYCAVMPGLSNLEVLRLLRTLRPLKTMGKLKGMRTVIKVIFMSFGPLTNVFLLSCMLFFIFGICGVQLFQGTMTQHCFSNSSSGWVLEEDGRQCGGDFTCATGQVCLTGKWSGYAAEGMGRAGNPNYGVTSFDTVPHAFLTIFVAITLEGWVDVMYWVQDSYGYIVPTVFFVFLILFGSLFVLNLALAVVTDKYDEIMSLTLEEEESDDEDDEDEDDETTEATRPQEAASLGIFHCLATSSTFNNVVFLFIIANTVMLALEHKRTCIENGVKQACDMSSTLADVLHLSNYIFIAIFTLECVIKLIGLGPSGYIQDRFNLFDATVVVMSYLELGLAGNSSFSALRCFRLARVFKMAKQWESLRVILETIIDTLPDMGNLSILLFLFMFIATVAGMQLFGGKLESTRSNFNNFGIGMLTVFQTLTGENWNEVFYDGVNVTSYASVAYFLTLVVIGNFIVLNLFLAILLSNFGSIPPPDINPEALAALLCGGNSAKVASAEEEEEQADDDDTFKNKLDHFRVHAEEGDDNDDENVTHIMISDICRQEDVKARAHDKVVNESGLLGPVDPYEPLVLEGRSLFCLEPTNPMRVAVARMVDTLLFEYVVLGCILVSSLCLALDGPTLDQGSALATFLNATNWVFTVLFTIELMLKVFVYGFFFTPQAYMKDNWNILDCLIVIISILSLTGAGGPFKSLRALRSLRPLRTIKRAPGLKVVVNALFACMPSFLNILIVSLLFYLVFSIMAVQFWAGKFWACRTGDGDYATHVVVGNATVAVIGVENCNGVTPDGTSVEWTNKEMNFDNIVVGMLTLFEVASLELWLDVLYDAMDVADEVGGQPSVFNHWESAFFFVVFIVVGSFLIMNLFVGAVVDNFNREKEVAKSGGAVTMSSDQEDFVDQLRVLVNNRPNPRPQLPQGEGSWVWLRRKCYKFVLWDSTGKQTGATFDAFVSCAIVLNVVNMSLYYWIPPESLVAYNSDDTMVSSDYVTALEYLNFIFTWIFIAEFVVKHMALGRAQYWQDWWNRVDGAVVIFSLVGFVMEAVVSQVTGVPTRLLRVFRATRVVRIVRLLKSEYAKGCLRLLETLAYTLPALGNVSALLLLVLFIYTTLGMAFFGDLPVKPDDDPEVYAKYPYQLYSEHANFKYFHIGMLTLFRMSTGESWNGIMHDCMTVYPASWVFFVSYMIIVAYIMFNLLIAVVLEEFSFRMKQEVAPVRPEHLHKFAIEWARFDPECTHVISAKDLAVLLKRLPPPLGLNGGGSSPVSALSESLHIPCCDGEVHFVETVMALVRYAYDLECDDEAVPMTENLSDFMDEQMVRPLPLVTMSKVIVRHFPSVMEFEDNEEFIKTYAAMRMQATLRGHYTRGTVIPDKKETVATGKGASSEAKATAPPEKWAESPSPGSKRVSSGTAATVSPASNVSKVKVDDEVEEIPDRQVEHVNSNSPAQPAENKNSETENPVEDKGET